MRFRICPAPILRPRSARWWRLVLLAAGAAIASTAAATEPRAADALEPLPAGAVTLGGPLGDAIHKAETRQLAAQSIDPLVQPFRERRDRTEWRSEFFGKWMTAAVAAWHDTPDPALRQKLETAISALISTQSPDGYIGAYADADHLQRWDVWGRKYTLLALLAWYDASHDPAVLAAARRHADFLISEVGPGRQHPFRNDMWNGMASNSVLEPIVLLYRRTGDQRYLDFANYLVEQWPSADGPDLLNKALAGTPVFAMFPGPKAVVKNYGDAGKSKAYEMMSCFEGLAELYRATGNPKYREAVEKLYANVRDTEITVIGSGSDWERWSDGRRRQTEPWHKGMETCVTVTWMKLTAHVLRLTGDPACVDEIERTAFNALLGAQAVDGTWWCHHTPLAGVKERAPEQCGMPQNCCVANGPRGLLLLPSVAVMNSAAGPVVNLYAPMKALVALAAGGHVTLEQATDFPSAGAVRLRVSPDETREFTLRLRVPAWSTRTAVRVNGKPISGVTPGKYVAVRRRWTAGDVVDLDFDLHTRPVRPPGGEPYVAFLRGPIVLARDERICPGALETAVQRVAEGPQTDERERSPALRAMNIRHVYDVAGLGTPLCDFASAGNTWTEASRYRVWLPLAAAGTASTR